MTTQMINGATAASTPPMPGLRTPGLTAAVVPHYVQPQVPKVELAPVPSSTVQFDRGSLEKSLKEAIQFLNKQMSSKNDITGDKIQTKGVLSKEGEARFEIIFRKITDAERYQFIRKVMLEEPVYNELQLQGYYVTDPKTEKEFDDVIDKYIKTWVK